MVAFTKIYEFGNHLLLGDHDLAAAADVVKIYLSNEAPNVATHVSYGTSAATPAAELNEFAGTGLGYTAGGQDISNSISEATGIWSVAAVDKTWTAATSAWSTFRYVAAYNSSMATTAGDSVDNGLIGYWDYGTGGATLAVSDTFAVNFSTNVLLTLNSKS